MKRILFLKNDEIVWEHKVCFAIMVEWNFKNGDLYVRVAFPTKYSRDIDHAEVVTCSLFWRFIVFVFSALGEFARLSTHIQRNTENTHDE